MATVAFDPAHSTDSRQALLDAAVVMLSRGAPSSVSGREVAAAAGVSYGQIHRLFGTKDDLMRAGLAELTERLMADAFPDGALVPTPGILSRHETFVRALSNVLVDGSAMRLSTDSPVVRRYKRGLEILRPDLDVDHRDTIVGLSVSLQFGIELHGRALTVGSGLGPDFDFRSPAVLLVHQLQGGLGPFAGDLPRPRKIVSHGPRDPQVPQGEGREAVERRLVAAACRMLEDRGPTAISGRRLADRAGVNYGLIHHYFGSATDIFAKAYDQVRREFYEAESQGHSAPDFFAAMAHPGYVRAVTNIALDAGPVAGSFFSVVEALVEQHQRLHGMTPDRTKFMYAASVSSQLAWALMKSLLDAGLDRDVSELQPLAAGYLARLFTP